MKRIGQLKKKNCLLIFIIRKLQYHNYNINTNGNKKTFSFMNILIKNVLYLLFIYLFLTWVLF